MMDSVIARLVAIRDSALARGDRNLAINAQIELDKRGWVDPPIPEDPMMVERAILEPVKRGPGRPRKNPL